MTSTDWDQGHANAWTACVWLHLQELQMSSANLAIVIGRTSDVVNGWLLEERQPSPEDCRDVARALSINASRLLELAGYIPLSGFSFGDETPAAD